MCLLPKRCVDHCFPYTNKAIPKRIRIQAFGFRGGYCAVNVLLLILIFNLDGTALWNGTSPSYGNIEAFLTSIVISWILYFSVQASDPGYLTAELAREAGLFEFDDDDSSLLATEMKPMSSSRARAYSRDADKDLENGGLDHGVKVGQEEEEEEDDRNDMVQVRIQLEEDEKAGLVDEPTKGSGTSAAKEKKPIEKRRRKERKKKKKSRRKHRHRLENSSSDEDSDFEDAALEIPGFPRIPLRAKYCRRSERVVATFDHFCGVLGTPIGERNHCRFWWFLLIHNIAVAWAIYIVHSGFRWRLFWETWFEVNGLGLFAAILIWIIFLSIFTLFCFHTFLAMSNMTTYELHKGRKLRYLAKFDELDLPFSQGVRRNVMLFCCKTGFWSNHWRPIKWERPQDFDRDSDDWYNNLWENKYWRCC